MECASILAGDATELRKASELIKVRPKVPVYEETYLEWTKDCAQFRTRRGYVQVRHCQWGIHCTDLKMGG